MKRRRYEEAFCLLMRLEEVNIKERGSIDIGE